MSEKKYTIRQLFNWNEQKACWEPKSKDELSAGLKNVNGLPLAAKTTPVDYFSRFNNSNVRVDMDDPSLTAFARAWGTAKYLDELLKKWWWMSKSDINKLKAAYEEQLSGAGVTSNWKRLRSKPKLTQSQIADYLLFVGAEAPNDDIKNMMASKVALKRESAKRRAANKKARESEARKRQDKLLDKKMSS